MLGLAIVVTGLAEWHGDSTSSHTLLEWGATWRYSVQHGEWWRLLTSVFPHVGLFHLTWNVVLGFLWCEGLEHRIGSRLFLGLYVLSGVVGSSVSVLGHDVVAAGASGAIFGVIGARWALDARASTTIAAFVSSRAREFVTTALWFVAGAQGLWDNYAHLGGLLAGLTVTLAATRPGAPARVAFSLVLALIPLSIFWVDPSERAVEEVSRAIAREQWAEAEAALSQVHGRAEWVYSTRCWLLAVQGRDVELDRLLQQPTGASADVWLIESELRLRQARFSEAEVVASKVITQRPASADGYLARFRARTSLGLWDEAIADLAKAEQLEPTHASLPIARTVTETRLGHREAALRHFTQITTQAERDFARDLLLDAGWAPP